MTPGERGALAAAVGLYLFWLQQLYLARIPRRSERLRTLAIARIACQRGMKQGYVAAVFDSFGGDGTRPPPRRRGRPITSNTATMRAANLSHLLAWALKRQRCAADGGKVSGIADTIACAVCLCDRSNLTNYRNGRIGHKGFPITHRLVQAGPDLRKLAAMVRDVGQHMTPRQRETVTTDALAAVATRLLKLAHRQHLRVARRGYGLTVIRTIAQ
jgi:hypothetical protein